MMALRPYQQRALDQLHAWWECRPGVEEAPLMVLPTGAGKSLVIAELCRLLFDAYPEAHPRTVVLVPSKELAEQNAQKLRERLPPHISVGYYSASLGKKVPDADVIVATIGSIYRDAHLLGNILCVLVDEAHLIRTDSTESGRYRQFLTSLAKLCNFRVAGWTATPFRGDGVWLTEGEAPLFTGVACSVPIQELLDAGFLAPLVRPIDVISTRIDTDDIRITGGDFNLKELESRVMSSMPNVVNETFTLAADRKKWIAFTPSVKSAEYMVTLMLQKGILAALVCGDTDKKERAKLIADFRAGRLRCLVTVLALAVGFDVPDVDCVIWCRPTKSPVLFVQGAGRGMRIAPGKTNCLWLDYSDTTERMGPVDTIRGRKKRSSKEEQGAPLKVCSECGERSPISALMCPTCGALFPVPEPDETPAKASTAAIMAHQLMQQGSVCTVSHVGYGIHKKEGKPDSLRVDYYSGLRRIAQEWVCLEHGGFAGDKASLWWNRRCPGYRPQTVREAMDHIDNGGTLLKPFKIVLSNLGKYPEIVRCEWDVKQVSEFVLTETTA